MFTSGQRGRATVRGMARRKAFVHIGLPRTGTGFVEHALTTHRVALADAGIVVPAISAEEMFRAAIEIRCDHKAWGYKRVEVEGAWAGVCRRARKLKGTHLITQELLAGATTDQISLLLDGLAGLEVHLVVTLRDPATQIAAEWEECIKSGRSVPFQRFRQRIMDPARVHEHAQRFWLGQHVGEVLDRWGAHVRPDRMHVVVVPRSADPGEHVWSAFGRIVGFDADAFPIAGQRRTPPALGPTEVAVLRGVNEAIDGRIEGQLRRTVVKRYFAERVLGDPDTTPAAVPADMYDDLVDLAEGWSKAIANAGYDVHGDLADLVPAKPSSSLRAPDDVQVEDRLHITTQALANVLVEVARLREHNQALEIRNGKLERKRRKLKQKLSALDAS